MDPIDKPQLRAQLRAARRERFARTDQRQRGSAIAAAALADPDVARACAAGAAIASFASYGAEPPTDQLNAALAVAGAQVLLPVIERGGVEYPAMAWADFSSGTVPGARRIPSPAGPLLGIAAEGLLALGCAVILVPALAAGRDGSRLGQGGGYYDRLFADLPPSPAGPLRIALVGADEVFDSVPTDPWDTPVNRTLTA